MGCLVLFLSEQLTRAEDTKGKKDCPGHTDDKIGLDAVRLLGITERSGAFS